MYSSDLTDSQWQNIKDNLDFKIWKRKRKHSTRLIINAILYINKTSIQWRMLPNDFPTGNLFIIILGNGHRMEQLKKSIIICFFKLERS